MSALPDWNINRARRLADEMRVAGVPAFADSWQEEAYLCVPIRFDEDSPLSRIAVWWTGDSWAVQSASLDGEETWGDVGIAPDATDDLPDGTVVSLLLGALIGSIIGADAYGDES